MGCVTHKRSSQEIAAKSAESTVWTLKCVPGDVRRMMARAIRVGGRDKKFWIVESLRAALAPYAGKKDLAPSILQPRKLGQYAKVA